MSAAEFLPSKYSGRMAERGTRSVCVRRAGGGHSGGRCSRDVAFRAYGLVVPVGDQDALEAALITALRKSWDRNAISAWGGSRSWKAVAGEVLHEMNQIVQGSVARAVRG